MKTGRTLQELATELDRQIETKVDYIQSTQQLEMHDNGMVSITGQGTFPVAEVAHRQIGTKLGIPAKYYDKMREEAPDLLASNVNRWFEQEPERRFVRTLDGHVRAFLSDSYRPLDNFDVAEAVLPVLTETSAEIVSCEVTERKLYLKAVVPSEPLEIGPAEGYEWGVGHQQVHKVQPGLVISNSEIGHGSLSVTPAVHTVHCTNLAVWNESAVTKRHLGGQLGKGQDDGVWEYLSDESKQKTDEALWYQVRDFVQAALTGNVFEDIVMQLRESRGHAIEGDVPAAVEVVAKNHQP